MMQEVKKIKTAVICRLLDDARVKGEIVVEWDRWKLKLIVLAQQNFYIHAVDTS